MTRTWGNNTFLWICSIHPEIDETGKIKEFIPHVHYKNFKGLSLNLYGCGPFCKFRIPNDNDSSGVYVLTIEEEAKYIGECVKLSSRFNNGYGNISPRNCYKGGQLTNCRINNLIYNVSKCGGHIELWFLKIGTRKIIETHLIDFLRPEWYRKTITCH